MSSKMYSFLDKLEELMENGEVTEGCYLKLCNALKEAPITDSQEDYWRENFHREEQKRIVEEERNNYLIEVLRFQETQNQTLYRLYNELHERHMGAQQQLERFNQRQNREESLTPKQKLVEFFNQMDRLSAIPRHKKKPYSKEEIGNMNQTSARVLYNKIFE